MRNEFQIPNSPGPTFALAGAGELRTALSLRRNGDVSISGGMGSELAVGFAAREVRAVL